MVRAATLVFSVLVVSASAMTLKPADKPAEKPVKKETRKPAAFRGAAFAGIQEATMG